MTSRRTLRRRSAQALLGLVLSAAMSIACAETRVALIIGNSTYQKAELRLANPANDAAAMARALKAAGFDTIVKLNAKRTDFYHAVDEFSAKIGRDPHAVGLFYYAGHAIQADGINYLIPVDADVQAQSDLEADTFDAGRVLRAMKGAQNDMNIVILDSCRNNPLPKTRGMDRGLARMEAPSGTFIAYAAAPGQTAQDGAAGTNGVFTGEFIKAMAEPGVPLEQMFKKVIIGVRADTKGAQQPWSEASIQGDFYFLPKGASGASAAGAAAAAAAATPNAPAAARHVDSANELEQSYWDRIKNSTDPADFKDYKAQYPSGAHAAEAALLLRKLSRPATVPVATRAVASQVESTAVGRWTMTIPSVLGPTNCFWEVRGNGTYSSLCVGAQPSAHSGNVSITDGKWALNATTTTYTDGGTYQFSNPNTLVMSGKLGVGAWTRQK